jgi:hypothetical protein
LLQVYTTFITLLNNLLRQELKNTKIIIMIRKILMSTVVLTCFSVSIVLFQFSCKKEVTAQTTPTCDVKSSYAGTSITSTGVSSAIRYELRENNFVVGFGSTGDAVTFGGYRNTCDSVIISVFYTLNNSYYLLQGKLGSNASAISGSYKNITTPTDFGTFSISK